MDKLKILANKTIKIKTNFNYNLNKMPTHGQKQWKRREGKSVGGCSGPNYGDWMKGKDEYLNEVK